MNIIVDFRQTASTTALLVFFWLLSLGMASRVFAQEDIANVQSKEYRLDKTGKLKYLLIGAKGAPKKPARGFKLLVVLPGGDGSRDFEPFVKRIYKHALSDDYLVVQLIAPKWNSRQRITWPTAKDSVRGAVVPVEKFLAKAVEDVGKRTKIDRRHIFTLSWSSGGPAAYAASLAKDTPITGSFVAMSVFWPKRLDLARAKGKPYYLLHSPEDKVCRYWMARSARDQLSHRGAAVKLVDYAGGHGWRGNVFGNIRSGIEWLEDHAKKAASEAKKKADDAKKKADDAKKTASDKAN